MKNYLYVDNSNVWIEGMHVSAVVNGIAPDIWSAIENKICDYEWKIDFGSLYQLTGGDKSLVGRAVLYGSRPPANDSLWSMAKKGGFEVIIRDRNLSNREKCIDTGIVTEIISDSYAMIKPTTDKVTLVSGDRDYVPMIENLRSRGYTVVVYFWEHASNDLKTVANEFISLNPHLETLKFIK